MDDMKNADQISVPDVAEFLKSAESAFNEKDIEAACADYAQDATLEFLTNGTYDSFSGLERIKSGWRGVFYALPYFSLRKTLVLSDGQKIVNEWEGTIDKRGKTQARGIEIWSLNASGKVVHHKLYTFLKLYSADDLRGKLLFGLTNPVLGWRLERERSKANNQD